MEKNTAGTTRQHQDNYTRHTYKNFNTQDNMENKCDAITARGTRCARNWSAQTVGGFGEHQHWCGQHCTMYTLDPNFRVEQGRRAAGLAARRDRIVDVRRAIELNMERAPNPDEAQRRLETAMAIFDGQGVGAAEALRVTVEAWRVIRGEVPAQAPVQPRAPRAPVAPEVLAARREVQLRNAEEGRMRRAAGAAVRPDANDIGALARDVQNTHTAVVAQQTNAGVEKLLAQHVPADQQTMMEIWHMWTSTSQQKHNPRGALQLFTDMLSWYETRDCKSHGDYLYKRLIDGLWALVQQTPDPELRQELRCRVAQEVIESKGMCCEGHVSRLVNVMVGFDDAFNPPVATGEVLQNRMAAIAAKDLDTEIKQAEARSVFAELGIPEAEQAAWLEAF